MASSSPPQPPERRPGRLVFFDRELLAARAYWRAALARELEPSGLPADRAARQAPPGRSAVHATQLSGEAWARARDLTRDRPALVHLLVTTACAVVLHRLTGSAVITLGTPARGADARPNALPLVIDVAPGQAFRALLAHVRGVAADAYAHQAYPHTGILADFGLAADAGRCALFDISVRCAGVHAPMPATAEDIAIEVLSGADALALQLHYKPALFDAESIERFAARINRVLAAGAASPEAPVGDIDILDAAERDDLTQRWPRAAERLDADLLHVAFRRHAARTPDAPAVVFEGTALAYGELDRRSDALAARLAALGVGPEAIVGLHLAPSPARVIGVLAVLKAGGAFLPLDPTYPPERLRDIVEQARPVAVVTEGGTFLDAMPAVPVVALEADGAPSAREARARAPDPALLPDNLAYVIYTSGSTGRPKGVACHHRGLANLAAAQVRAFAVDASSRVLQFASFGFDASVSEIAMALTAGAALVMAPRERLFPGEALHAFLERERITHVTLVPSVLELMPARPLPLLRTLAVAGEACPAHLVDRWSRGRLMLNAYGPTEVTVCATMGRCTPGDPHPAIGRPMANMETYVLDERLQPVPAGVEGELWVGGAGVARGYLGAAAATADRFVPHPFAPTPGARLYRTGDRARFRRDATLDCLGRSDTQVKLRGFRIELGEVEAVLRAHPQVAEAAVLLREDTPGDRRLVAYVETRSPAPLTQAALRAHLAGRVPDYMVAQSFVVMPSLPRTAKGSIARASLPAPEGAGPGGAKDGPLVEPRDTVELELVRIWERVLGHRPIGVRDNFFALGGHSFLAVRMLAEIRERFASDLPLPVVLQRPTIEALAAVIHERGEEPPWSPLVTLRAGGTRAPLFCVHPAGGTVLCYVELAEALAPDVPFHALQAQGLAAGQEPLRSVEDMAALYREAVLAAQPRGPYHLAGWSAGGLIAWELAQQLRARGHDVALLAMFDTYAPAALDLPEPGEEDDVRNMVTLLGSEVALDEARLRALGREARLEYVLDAAKAAGIIPPGYRAGDARRLIDVFAAVSRAAGAYRPAAYAGRVMLFAAQEETAAAVVDPGDRAHGFGPLARGELVVHPLAGSHLELMRQPLAASIAARLRAALG